MLSAKYPRAHKSAFLISPAVLYAAFFSCTGWFLSAIGQLNSKGYAVALLVGLVLAWRIRPDFGRVRLRRFRHIFPAAFLVLTALAACGGVLYPPTNYDGLAYRLPRVLHWLAEGHWHWIHTGFPRLNTRGTGWEWMAAPVLALYRSYRWLFLINAVAFCILPGLIFSLFTRLGVGRKVAWHWMWLLPTGYCFLLQTGSISNDMLGAVWALAAVDYALRARGSQRLSDMWLSGLAAALMVGSKSSNLPLLLPWAVALIPVLHLLRKQVLVSCAVGLVGLGASFLPMAYFNQKHCGDWSGLKLEFGQRKSDPVFRICANTILLSAQNLVPPLFPWAARWNARVESLIPEKTKLQLRSAFELGGANFAVPDMQAEEAAGLGFGVSAALVVSAVVGFCRSPRLPWMLSGNVRRLYKTALITAPWASLLFLTANSGISTFARVVCPYYGLLVPALICSQAQSRLVSTRWWRKLAITLFIIALFPLVLSPARPLWPAQTVLSWFNAAQSSNPLLRRAALVYNTYGARSDAFRPALAVIPAEVKILGLVTFDDPEATLWEPIGERRIYHVIATDRADDLRSKGIDYVLVNPEKLQTMFGRTIEEWSKQMGLELVRVIPMTLKAKTGELDWFLLRQSAREKHP